MAEQEKGHQVYIFRAFPFQVGQKIFVESGPRRGDWEVIAVSDQKVKFRCPVSHREFEWDRYYYLLERRENEPWPHSH
jgi:hypothetical protein